MSVRFPSSAFRPALLAGLAFAASAQAQVEPAGATSPFALTSPVEIGDYNLRFGPLELDLGAGFGVEYNDNIAISEDDRRDEIILKPGITLGTRWQLTEFQAIEFAIDAQYWYYVNDYEDVNNTNTLRISPQTELAYRVRLGDAIFRVYDRFEYRFDADEDFVSPAGDENEVINQQLYNELGVQTGFNLWTDNEVFVQLSRRDRWTPEDEFQYINRTTYEGRLQVRRPVASNLTVGVGTSYAVENYEEDVNNDGRYFTVGPFAELAVTEFLLLSGLVAWDYREYDGDGLDTNDSYQGLSGALRLTHIANDFFSHSVGVFSQPESSGIANFNEATGAEYRALWQIAAPLALDGIVRYENVDASGSSLGIAPDDYERVTAGFGFGYQFGPRFFGNLSYRYIDKESEAAGRSYTQNRILIDLSYDF